MRQVLCDPRKATTSQTRKAAWLIQGPAGSHSRFSPSPSLPAPSLEILLRPRVPRALPDGPLHCSRESSYPEEWHLGGRSSKAPPHFFWHHGRPRNFEDPILFSVLFSLDFLQMPLSPPIPPSLRLGFKFPCLLSVLALPRPARVLSRKAIADGLSPSLLLFSPLPTRRFFGEPAPESSFPHL